MCKCINCGRPARDKHHCVFRSKVKALTKCPKNNDLTYKRDLIWMTINVIKYYVELGQLMEA